MGMTIDDDSEVLIGYFASSHGEANQGTIVQCPGAVPRSPRYYCTGLPTSYLRVVFLVMGNGRTNKGCVYVVFDEHNRMEQGEKQRIHSYQWRNTCPSEIPIC
ncbi:hypothetical protein MCOR02_001570 [Pyricularia oryzae]|uniref:Uncharacterized protein n=2 Tax=Pyricularia TaxID=48558 RepID=A0ABQ8N911_PYRGI|nr:uncharacterized protein MGG_15560 [Pyricularia oryzae 70-15]KAH9437928.1 hypothetical protein MCOR02_001570 [Pyricularia oryzae]KAI6293253.1 hypothetical protein MCOR33_009281 [Pyricularia grisea]EHA53874.1 hypothetical protein MGG_15560 [Pyricularia oryzae 70-15]KAI6283056.1 hypothetical protein MCOR26_002596 [Pyricularia oryzae]KAI6316634.1 hypothetical protein MCOR30_009235 [Pyricularia oryzae]